MAVNSKVNVEIALKSRMRGINQAISGVAKLAGGLIAAASAYASMRQLISGSRDILALGADLEHLRNQTGVAVSDLVILRQAFEDNGISSDNARLAINKLQKSLVEAGEGTGEALKAFETLGIDLERIRSLSPAEQFVEIGEAIKKMEDPAERSAAAMRIFGRAGAELQSLFVAGDLDEVRKSLGILPEVLQRNAVLFERIDTLLGRLTTKSRQFFAGLIDQLAPSIAAPLELLNTFDFTPMGQRLGAVFNLALQAFRDGTVSELIGLAIGAGFELGWEAIKAGFASLVSYIISPAPWQGLLDVFIVLSEKINTALVEAIYYPFEFLTAGIVKAGSEIRVMWERIALGVRNLFADLLNFFASGLETTVNANIIAINKLLSLLGKESLELISLSRLDQANKKIAQAVTWEEAYAEQVRIGAEERAKILESQQRGGDQLRELLGIEKRHTEETGKQLSYRERLAALIDSQVATRSGSTPGAPSGQGVFSAPEAETGAPSFSPVLEQTSLLEDSLRSGVGGAMDLLTGKAKTLGDFFSGIGNTIQNRIQGNLADTVVAFATGQKKMLAVSAATKAKDSATTAAKGAADAAAMAPAAAAASTASFGFAAIAGQIALAALLAFASSSFYSGGHTGFTGPGGRYQPAGIVHRDEYVMDRYATRAIGIENLDYMRKHRQLPGYFAGGRVLDRPTPPPSFSQPGGSGSSSATPVYLAADRRDAQRQAALSSDKALILETIAENRDLIFPIT